MRFLDTSKHKGQGRLLPQQLVSNSGQQWRVQLVRGITKVGRPWHGRWSKLPGQGYTGEVASRNHREGKWQEVPSGHTSLRQADHKSQTPDLAVKTMRQRAPRHPRDQQIPDSTPTAQSQGVPSPTPKGRNTSSPPSINPDPA